MIEMQVELDTKDDSQKIDSMLDNFIGNFEDIPDDPERDLLRLLRNLNQAEQKIIQAVSPSYYTMLMYSLKSKF